MKIIRKYLILCGLLFNLAFIAICIVELTANESMLQKGIDWASSTLVNDHPSLNRFISKVDRTETPSTVLEYNYHAPSEEPFKPVELVHKDDDPHGERRVLYVGRNHALKTPGAASKVARDGDVILIEPGRYIGDVAIWNVNDITIKGNKGMVSLNAEGVDLPQKKAIWLIQGDRVRIENIEFSGAQSPDKNGAGIRAEGAGLHIINCYFHHNEEGILGNPNSNSDMLIEHSEFAYNGHSNGQSHNIYIGSIKRLILRFNYIHHAFVGSNVKTRAKENHILYNEIMDYEDGRVNYGIDISSGGVAYVIGNVLQQGANTENYHMLTFAPEQELHPKQELYVVNNTFVNDRSSGQFVRNNSSTVAYVYNNLFVGVGGIITGDAILVGNVISQDNTVVNQIKNYFNDIDSIGGLPGSGNNRIVTETGLKDRSGYNYHLSYTSKAIDAGLNLESVNGVILQPQYQYQHPRQGVRREIINSPDAGAYEAPQAAQ